MGDLLKVGLFAVVCVAVTAIVIAWFNGPAWYAIGPGLVFAAYAMILFARFKRGANI